MPSKKSGAVFGYTIEEVKVALRATPFVRDSSKKQYKTVNGKHCMIYCNCGNRTAVEHPQYWSSNFLRLKPDCPTCHTMCFVDLTACKLLHLPEE